MGLPLWVAYIATSLSQRSERAPAGRQRIGLFLPSNATHLLRGSVTSPGPSTEVYISRSTEWATPYGFLELFETTPMKMHYFIFCSAVEETIPFALDISFLSAPLKIFTIQDAQKICIYIILFVCMSVCMHVCLFVCLLITLERVRLSIFKGSSKAPRFLGAKKFRKQRCIGTGVGEDLACLASFSQPIMVIQA